MAQLNANLSNYEAQEGFEVLPPGWHLARIENSEIKQGPKGPYINWTFEIDGKLNRIWEVMSLGSDVSLRKLKTLAQCAGHQNPNYIADTEELHGMKVLVRLKIEKSNEYGDKNKITAFKSPKKPQEQSINSENESVNLQDSTIDNTTPPDNNPQEASPENQKVKMPWEK